MAANSSMEASKTINLKEIIKILPHRYPFLLVDRILAVDIEAGTITGQKNVSINEPFFQGHFPEVAIMPGVLVLEALAQVGGILVHLKGHSKKIAVLLTVNNAKFRNPVHPGDVLLLHGEGLHVGSRGGKIRSRAIVNDKVVAEAEIGFALVDINQI